MPFMHWVSGEPECGLISPPEYGTHGLTCYYPGTTNLIISVPHGGEMKPPFIADRQKPPSSRSAAVEQDKVVKEKNQVGTNGGTKLNREASDPDEDTAGRISIAADIYTQVRVPWQTQTGKIICNNNKQTVNFFPFQSHMTEDLLLSRALSKNIS